MQVALRDPLLYGDYRTALFPEQPRVYEDIQDYDAAKGLFEEVHISALNFPIHNSLSPSLPCRYWKNTMTNTKQ